MARIGVFDETDSSAGWFDESASSIAWFDEDFPAGGTATLPDQPTDVLIWSDEGWEDVQAARVDDYQQCNHIIQPQDVYLHGDDDDGFLQPATDGYQQKNHDTQPADGEPPYDDLEYEPHEGSTEQVELGISAPDVEPQYDELEYEAHDGSSEPVPTTQAPEQPPDQLTEDAEEEGQRTRADDYQQKDHDVQPPDVYLHGDDDDGFLQPAVDGYQQANNIIPDNDIPQSFPPEDAEDYGQTTRVDDYQQTDNANALPCSQDEVADVYDDQADDLLIVDDYDNSYPELPQSFAAPEFEDDYLQPSVDGYQQQDSAAPPANDLNAYPGDAQEPAWDGDDDAATDIVDDYDNSDPWTPWDGIPDEQEDVYEEHNGSTGVVGPSNDNDIPQSFDAEWAEEDYAHHEGFTDPVIIITAPPENPGRGNVIRGGIWN